MKKFPIWAVLGAALLASPLSAQDHTAPGFKLYNILSTNQITLSQFQGKVVVLNFWATWCPPCKAEIPDLIRIQKEFSNDVVVIGVSVDRESPDYVAGFSEELGINYPVVMADSKLINLYGGIRAIPTTFIIDQDGDIGQKIVGMRDFNGFLAVLKPYLED